MMPPTKDQTDIGQDNPTIDTSNGAIVELPNGEMYKNKDMTHQEYGQDADVNHMLNKFGITPERGTPTFGEWDDSIDLQQALTSVTEARTAFKGLPDELKNKFKSMEELLTAYNNGNLIIKDGEAPVPQKTPTELLQERIDKLQERLDTPHRRDTPPA